MVLQVVLHVDGQVVLQRPDGVLRLLERLGVPAQNQGALVGVSAGSKPRGQFARVCGVSAREKASSGT